jgi:hypothetical protein
MELFASCSSLEYDVSDEGETNKEDEEEGKLVPMAFQQDETMIDDIPSPTSTARPPGCKAETNSDGKVNRGSKEVLHANSQVERKPSFNGTSVDETTGKHELSEGNMTEATAGSVSHSTSETVLTPKGHGRRHNDSSKPSSSSGGRRHSRRLASRASSFKSPKPESGTSLRKHRSLVPSSLASPEGRIEDGKELPSAPTLTPSAPNNHSVSNEQSKGSAAEFPVQFDEATETEVSWKRVSAAFSKHGNMGGYFEKLDLKFSNEDSSPEKDSNGEYARAPTESTGKKPKKSGNGIKKLFGLKSPKKNSSKKGASDLEGAAITMEELNSILSSPKPIESPRKSKSMRAARSADMSNELVIDLDFPEIPLHKEMRLDDIRREAKAVQPMGWKRETKPSSVQQMTWKRETRNAGHPKEEGSSQSPSRKTNHRLSGRADRDGQVAKARSHSNTMRRKRSSRDSTEDRTSSHRSSRRNHGHVDRWVSSDQSKESKPSSRSLIENGQDQREKRSSRRPEYEPVNNTDHFQDRLNISDSSEKNEDQLDEYDEAVGNHAEKRPSHGSRRKRAPFKKSDSGSDGRSSSSYCDEPEERKSSHPHQSVGRRRRTSGRLEGSSPEPASKEEKFDVDDDGRIDSPMLEDYQHIDLIPDHTDQESEVFCGNEPMFSGDIKEEESHTASSLTELHSVSTPFVSKRPRASHHRRPPRSSSGGSKSLRADMDRALSLRDVKRDGDKRHEISSISSRRHRLTRGNSDSQFTTKINGPKMVSVNEDEAVTSDNYYDESIAKVNDQNGAIEIDNTRKTPSLAESLERNSLLNHKLFDDGQQTVVSDDGSQWFEGSVSCLNIKSAASVAAPQLVFDSKLSKIENA